MQSTHIYIYTHTRVHTLIITALYITYDVFLWNVGRILFFFLLIGMYHCMFLYWFSLNIENKIEF